MNIAKYTAITEVSLLCGGHIFYFENRLPGCHYGWLFIFLDIASLQHKEYGFFKNQLFLQIFLYLADALCLPLENFKGRLYVVNYWFLLRQKTWKTFSEWLDHIAYRIYTVSKYF